MKSYYIHLIRHALCEGNLEGRYIGRTESPLSMEGIKELLNLKTNFKYPYATHFYASPNTRSVDSLKVLYPDANPKVILEMAECDFGDWENKKPEELKNDPVFKAWAKGEQGANPPNGESNAVFMQRVCKGFETLVSNMMFSGEENVVLVTHAGVIMTILAAYGLPRAKMTDWMCESGQGFSIRLDIGNWSRAGICEIFQTLPITDENEEIDHSYIDTIRGVADKFN